MNPPHPLGCRRGGSWSKKLPIISDNPILNFRSDLYFRYLTSDLRRSSPPLPLPTGPTSSVDLFATQATPSREKLGRFNLTRKIRCSRETAASTRALLRMDRLNLTRKIRCSRETANSTRGAQTFNAENPRVRRSAKRIQFTSGGMCVAKRF